VKWVPPRKEVGKIDPEAPIPQKRKKKIYGRRPQGPFEEPRVRWRKKNLPPHTLSDNGKVSRPPKQAVSTQFFGRKIPSNNTQQDQHPGDVSRDKLNLKVKEPFPTLSEVLI